jgi:uncharacterized protein (TIGR02246 family)
LTVVRTVAESATTENVIAGMIRAWNSGSAMDFAGFFAENADLVNIHGMHLRGRQAIAGLYEMLFRSVFAQSTVEDSISTRRKLRADVELVHAKIKFTVRQGPMFGEQNAVISLVMTHQQNRWMVSSMHNTLVAQGRN